MTQYIAQFVGLFLVVIGYGIRLYAMRTLKKGFNLQLKMTTIIIKSGLYKYIRHPCYLGSIIVIAGLSFVYIPLAITYLAFAFFLARAINEEQILSINPEYKEYQKGTGMFIPRIKWLNKIFQ